jgi:hypothetical protein
MSQRVGRSRGRKNHFFSRSLRHELLETRSLMAGDILDTPTDPNIDMSSGFAEIRGALDYEGDVDVLRLNVADQNSFSAGAFKVEGGESLQFRVLDASGQEVSGATADSSGWINLSGTAKGEYSLEIASPTNEVTEYSVRVSAWTAEPPTFPEVTPRPDDADEIGPDATVLDTSGGYAWTDGELVGANDKDVFTFEISESGPIIIAASPYRVDPAGFQITLLDAEGVQYGQGDQTNLIEAAELAAGKYYVVVSDANGESVGYSLFITSRFSAEGGGDVRSDGSEENEEVTVDDVTITDGNPSGDDFEVGEELPGGFLLRMHNIESPADVDGDSSLTPLDALVLINLLNARGAGSVASFAAASAQGNASEEATFLDTDNDGYFSPLDVLVVINSLNAQMAESLRSPIVEEVPTDSTESDFAAAVDWAFSADDDDEDRPGLWCDLPIHELVG